VLLISALMIFALLAIGILALSLGSVHIEWGRIFKSFSAPFPETCLCLQKKN